MIIMKEKLFRAVALVLAMFLLCSCAGAETEVKDLAYYMGDISVYCKHWNQSVGSAFGTDMSFDSDKMEIVKSTSDVIVANYDGIIAETDWKFNVFSLRTNLTPSDKNSYRASARACAIISAVAYDFPYTESEMTDRYISTLNLYMDFLSANLENIMAKGKETMEITTELGKFAFDFLYMEDGIYLSWGEVKYPYN